MPEERKENARRKEGRKGVRINDIKERRNEGYQCSYGRRNVEGNDTKPRQEGRTERRKDDKRGK